MNFLLKNLSFSYYCYLNFSAKPGIFFYAPAFDEAEDLTNIFSKYYQFYLLIADCLTLSFLRKIVTPAEAGPGIQANS